MSEIEVESLVGAPSPWTALYLGYYMTAVDFRTGRVRSEDNGQDVRHRSQIHQWMRMEVVYLFFVHWVHTIIHGVTHRGFNDPCLRANHGRFTGILTRLPPERSRVTIAIETDG